MAEQWLPDEIAVKWPDPTAVYRYYAEDGALLYVGIANNPRLRNQAHAKRDWFYYSKYWLVEWFPTRALAEWSENRAINRESPEFNGKSYPDYDFVRVIDQWFLADRGDSYRGDFQQWHEWPDGATSWSGNVFRKCPAPDLHGLQIRRETARNQQHDVI